MANGEVWALALNNKHGYAPGHLVMEPETAATLLHDHPDDFVRAQHSTAPGRLIAEFACCTGEGWIDPDFAHLFRE